MGPSENLLEPTNPIVNVVERDHAKWMAMKSRPRTRRRDDRDTTTPRDRRKKNETRFEPADERRATTRGTEGIVVYYFATFCQSTLRCDDGTPSRLR